MKYDINFSVKYPLKESGTGLNFRQKENGRNMNMHICTHMSALKESGKLTLIRYYKNQLFNHLIIKVIIITFLFF